MKGSFITQYNSEIKSPWGEVHANTSCSEPSKLKFKKKFVVELSKDYIRNPKFLEGNIRHIFTYKTFLPTVREAMKKLIILWSYFLLIKHFEPPKEEVNYYVTTLLVFLHYCPCVCVLYTHESQICRAHVFCNMKPVQHGITQSYISIWKFF